MSMPDHRTRVYIDLTNYSEIAWREARRGLRFLVACFFSRQSHKSFDSSEDLGVTLEVLVASRGTTNARLRVGPHLPTRTPRLLVGAIYILSLTATTRSL